MENPHNQHRNRPVWWHQKSAELVAVTQIVAGVPASRTISSGALGDDSLICGQITTDASAEPPLADNRLPFVYLNPWKEDSRSIGGVFRKETPAAIDVSGLLVIRSLCAEVRPTDVIVRIDKLKIINKGNANRGVEKTTRIAGPVDRRAAGEPLCGTLRLS